MNLFSAILLSAISTATAIDENRVAKPKLTKAQRIEMALTRTGGTILDTRNQTGVVAFVNAQQLLPVHVIKSVACHLSKLLKIKVVVKEIAEINLTSASERFKGLSVNAAVFLTDTKDAPGFIVSPDECWSFINVALLKSGDIEARAKKQMLRAFAYACGAGSATYEKNIMGRVTEPNDLDKIIDPSYAYDTVQNIEFYLKSIGVNPGEKTLYIRACREGWAPAPTNDIQRAVWDKVHSIPNKPLKIEFDPATQKGKVTK